jgi:hypothetical protein
MSGAQPSETVWEIMSHDVATGGDSTWRSCCFILIVRIGNMNRSVESVLRVATVEYVMTPAESYDHPAFLWRQ